MNTKTHPLFEAYPLGVEKEISVGRVPTPYHIYDGQGLFIGGTADLKSIKSLLQNEKVHPIQTTEGHAVMGIWVVDFTQASLSAHNELQFSILVSHDPVPPIESHPLTLLKALFANPQARMFCYGLWNNTEQVVAYNQELLGLPAQLTSGTIKNQPDHKTFHFADTAGQTIFEGSIHVDQRTSPQVGWSMFRLLGLRQTLKAFSQPYLGAKVVNPISEAFPFNGDAQSYLASDTPIVQWFDASTDHVAFGEASPIDVNFQPQFAEHFAPFRFVYLEPIQS